MTTKGTKTIKIPTMETETVDITITGTTPLIVYAWEEKAKRMMLDQQMGKAKKKQHDIKIPYNDFMNSLYWLTEKPGDGTDDLDAERKWLEAVNGGAKFGFPVSAIKESAVLGARIEGIDVTMARMRGAFHIRGTAEASTPLIAGIVGPAPGKREDLVRVGKGRDRSVEVRYRGEFKTWEIPLRLTYIANGRYSLEQILHCFNAGGFMVGIGEWRPGKGGQYGMYELKRATREA